MKKLTKEDIFNCNDLPIKEVKVPEWGGSVYIKALSVGQFNSLKEKKIESKEYFIRILAMSLVTEQGVRLMDDEEIKVLLDKSPSAVERIFDEILILNNLKNKIEQAVKDKKDAIKDNPL